MPAVMPRSVQEALGKEVAADLASHIDITVSERTVSQDEYSQISSRLEVLEHDVSDLKAEVKDLRRTMDKRFDRMNERFDRMNERFDQMNARFEERFEQMNARSEKRFDQMYNRMLIQTRWMVGSLTVIGTLITVLLAIGQFVK